MAPREPKTKKTKNKYKCSLDSKRNNKNNLTEKEKQQRCQQFQKNDDNKFFKTLSSDHLRVVMNIGISKYKQILHSIEQTEDDYMDFLDWYSWASDDGQSRDDMTKEDKTYYVTQRKYLTDRLDRLRSQLKI